MTKGFPSKKPSKIGLEAKTCEMACFSRATRSQRHPFAPRCQKNQPFYNAINCKNSLSRKYFSSLFLLNLKKLKI